MPQASLSKVLAHLKFSIIGSKNSFSDPSPLSLVSVELNARKLHQWPQPLCKVSCSSTSCSMLKHQILQNDADLLSVPGARSLYGCWTCRLRKKKCDESRPICSTCTSLELDCHGYGPRPEWMDKGVLEREKALEVKRNVSETKSKRRQRRLWRTPQYPRPEWDQLEKRHSLCLPLSGSTQEATAIQGRTTPNHHLQLHDCEEDLTTFNQPMWSGPLYNASLPTESVFSQEVCVLPSNQWPCDAGTTIENGDTESNSASPESSQRASASTLISSALREDIAQNCIEFSTEAVLEAPMPLCQPKLSASCHDTYVSKESISSNQVCSSSFLQESFSLPSGIMGHHPSSPSSVSESILRRGVEDSLLMHYLDHVFYVQYPFYHSGSRQGRGWLFSILRRAKSAYYTALALSEHHQYSTLPQHGCISRSPHRLRERGGHYDQALREMQLILATWTGNLDLSRNIDILASILLLLFWEVCLPLLGVVSNADKPTKVIWWR
jgi:hypothetical protein